MTEPPPDGKWSKLDWVQGSGPVPQTPSADPPRSSVRRFPYRPRTLPMLLGAIFFGICGLVLAHTALTNNRGLVINGIIHLEAEGASIFYWCMSAVSFGFVAIVIFFALPQMFMKREIVIDDSSITVPGWGFSTRSYRIEFRDIHNVSVRSYEHRRQKYTTVKVEHIDGKNSIQSNMLPNDSDTDSILYILQREMASRREHSLACGKCGYSLRGNTTGICPECGSTAAG